MNQLIRMIGLCYVGYLFVSMLEGANTQITTSYLHYFTYPLLAIGLYGSVAGIDVNQLKDKLAIKIAINAISIGVLLKIIIVGLILFSFTQDKISFLLATIVAQIDPLSVASLNNAKNRLSDRGKLILNTWASFDDPVTTLTAIYVSNLLVNPTASSTNQLFLDYLSDIFSNIAFSVLVFAIHKLGKKIRYMDYSLLFLAFIVAISTKMMLGIAIIGLFLRPNLAGYLEKSVSFALSLSLLLLGTLMSGEMSLLIGLLLAVSIVLAQILVTFLLSRELVKKDRLYLAFAQQNGITAIILALLFEQHGTISIIAPAILFINLIHLIANHVLDKLNKEAKVVVYEVPVVVQKKVKQAVSTKKKSPEQGRKSARVSESDPATA